MLFISEIADFIVPTKQKIRSFQLCLKIRTEVFHIFFYLLFIVCIFQISGQFI